MGRQRKARHGRNVHGLLLLDKPAGMTSNEALQRVKRLFKARKAGHTGSLDKSATGLLPLCFGEATKLSSFLLDADKRYITTFRLGVETATGDAEGEVIHERPVPDFTGAQIERALACGAHVSALRRIATGPFRETEMVGLTALEERAARGDAELSQCLHPIDAVLRDRPSVELTEAVAYYLRQGQAVLVPNAPTQGILRMYTNTGQFLGVGEVLDDGRVAPRRLINL